MFATAKIKIERISENMYAFIQKGLSVEVEFNQNKAIVYYNQAYSFECTGCFRHDVSLITEMIIRKSRHREPSLYDFFRVLDGLDMPRGNLEDIKKIIVKGERVILKGTAHVSGKVHKREVYLP